MTEARTELDRLTEVFEAARRGTGLNREKIMVEVRKYRAHQERLLPILHAEMKAELIEGLKRKVRDGT